MISSPLYQGCSQSWLPYAQWKLPGYTTVMKYWCTFDFAFLYQVDCEMAQRLPPACPLRLDLGRIDARCADAAAAHVTAQDIHADGGVLPLLLRLPFLGRCVLGLMFMGWWVFGMGLRLQLSFCSGTERFGCKLSTAPGFRLLGQYEFLVQCLAN